MHSVDLNAEHSPFGASSANRWMSCAGSVKLLQEHPMPSSDAAIDGTRTHDLAEIVLSASLAGEDVPLGVLPPGCDAERRDRIRRYVDYILDQTNHFDELDMESCVEQRFNLNHIDERLFGRNDCAVWDGSSGELHVFDLKDGANIVSAEDNLQLGYYAIGCIHENKLTPESVHLHIVQPRMDNYSKWEASHEWLDELAVKLKLAVEHVDANPDEFVPGDHCKYCNKRMCPRWAEDVTGALVMMDKDPVLDLFGKELSVDQVVELLSHKDTVNQCFKDAETLLKRLAENGTPIPGMKLVDSLGNREWADPEKVMKKQRAWGLKKADMFDEPKLRSPTQMAKAGVDKAEIDALVVRQSRGLKLVPESAKGEPVLLNGVFDSTNDVI